MLNLSSCRRLCFITTSKAAAGDPQLLIWCNISVKCEEVVRGKEIGHLQPWWVCFSDSKPSCTTWPPGGHCTKSAQCGDGSSQLFPFQVYCIVLQIANKKLCGYSCVFVCVPINTVISQQFFWETHERRLLKLRSSTSIINMQQRWCFGLSQDCISLQKAQYISLSVEL